MGLTLYPNPTEDRINVMITSPLSTSAQIKIFDIMGREVYNANNQVLVQGQNQLTVPVQNLESGNYTIHLLMDSQAITAPFIKM
jgi:hypothetical protein